jgi:hypothetical protein
VRPAAERDVHRVRMAAESLGASKSVTWACGVRPRAAASPAMPEPMTAIRFTRGSLRPGAPAGGGAPGCEEECRRAPPGERGREEGGGEPPGDFSRQDRPAPRRKPVRRALAAPPGLSRMSGRRFGTSNLSDAPDGGVPWSSKSAAFLAHRRLPAPSRAASPTTVAPRPVAGPTRAGRRTTRPARYRRSPSIREGLCAPRRARKEVSD